MERKRENFGIDFRRILIFLPFRHLPRHFIVSIHASNVSQWSITCLSSILGKKIEIFEIFTITKVVDPLKKLFLTDMPVFIKFLS